MAVQVDPIKPTLKAPGIRRLKLIRDEPLSNRAFQFKLRRYNVSIRGNFDNAFDAATAMTVLITTENFPDVFRPALREGSGVPRWASAVFFVSFIVVGVWLGMSLWVTVIFETYKQQHRVGRCRFPVSKLVLKAPMVSALEAMLR